MTPLQTILDDIDLHGSNASPATLAAVTDLAIEIAREGREGRSIGILFTVGAETHVLQHSRCLILDPLAGESTLSEYEQPLGLGTRHIAAASISAALAAQRLADTAS